MKGFDNHPAVRGDATGLHWQLVEPMRYGGVIVPAGFETDMASVPRIFWWLISPWGSHWRAAILHDFLYREGRKSRLICDQLFRVAMEDDGVTLWRRMVLYRAVRLFGKRAYHTRQKEN